MNISRPIGDSLETGINKGEGGLIEIHNWVLIIRMSDGVTRIDFYPVRRFLQGAREASIYAAREIAEAADKAARYVKDNRQDWWNYIMDVRFKVAHWKLPRWRG